MSASFTFPSGSAARSACDVDGSRSSRPYEPAAELRVHGPRRERETGLGSSPVGGRATREEILDVAARLLVSEGLAELSVQSVASHAQVESALIGRWWPSEDALALDALRHVWLGLAVRMHHGAARAGL